MLYQACYIPPNSYFYYIGVLLRITQFPSLPLFLLHLHLHLHLHFYLLMIMQHHYFHMYCCGTQFETVFGEKPQCVKVKCGGSLTLRCWKVGQSHSLQPRILHSCKCTVLLVSSLYSCSFGHEVCSTDPVLTSKLSQEHLPFVLLHT